MPPLAALDADGVLLSMCTLASPARVSATASWKAALPFFSVLTPDETIFEWFVLLSPSSGSELAFDAGAPGFRLEGVVGLTDELPHK